MIFYIRYPYRRQQGQTLCVQFNSNKRYKIDIGFPEGQDDLCCFLEEITESELESGLQVDPFLFMKEVELYDPEYVFHLKPVVTRLLIWDGIDL